MPPPGVHQNSLSCRVCEALSFWQNNLPFLKIIARRLTLRFCGDSFCGIKVLRLEKLVCHERSSSSRHRVGRLERSAGEARVRAIYDYSIGRCQQRAFGAIFCGVKQHLTQFSPLFMIRKDLTNQDRRCILYSIFYKNKQKGYKNVRNTTKRQ